MLKLKNIKKSYKTGDFVQQALKGVSLDFRENEFVAILGTSGSGKTTLLNIIGGLDRYDSGDLIINGKSTKDFKDKDWDSYRNNSVGFIFQSYNLIGHISVLANVEMSMTLSGVSSKEKRKRALEVLEKVGLKDHANKKPNQLSGGQMQRVAIARALVNNPEIILADEPTGALDSTTSVQIMELIKEIAKEKLVIMVTHNPELARDYATRIVNVKDGEIISDSNPVNEEETGKEQYKLKKTSMGFFTALKLSFTNIWTKKGRTLLTALASSIGIIGIAVILSLSTGFQAKIDEYMKDAMDQFPIIINATVAQVDEETMKQHSEEMSSIMNGTAEYANTDEVILYDSSFNSLIHKNVLSDEYREYLNNIDKDTCSSIGYIRIASMNVLRKIDNKVVPVSFSAGINQEAQSSASGMTNMSATTYPTMLDENRNYLHEYYDVLAGEYPKNTTDVVLVVDSKNRVDINTMKSLGYDTENLETIKFNDIIGTEMKLVSNNDYYSKTQMGTFAPNSDYETMYNEEDNITLKVVGVIRSKQDVKISLLAGGIAYSNELSEMVIQKNLDSDIVKAQNEANYNIFTRQSFSTEDEKEQMIWYLGGTTVPAAAIIYPTSFDKKEDLINYLDKYNEGKDLENQVIYTDLSETITGMTSGIMDAITIVLVAFSAISLVVSTIMIAIITYISVLERTKEIGILRAMGARKKDITRVFNAETFIIGLCSGALGILIAYLLTIPINNVIKNLTELENVANLNPIHAILLVAISIILTLIGGWIPAKMAAKKDPVNALRTE
ncbi:MAG: ATP-binding cassette domain-containing protein [Clostridia bacterium]|nr:ATP-binding cassette domain-containing protein [Clostridia bacterium]